MNREQNFEIGSTAKLRCLVSDTAKADVFWTKNDMPVAQTDRSKYSNKNPAVF